MRVDEASDEVALKVATWESASTDCIRPKATELNASEPMKQIEEHQYNWRSKLETGAWQPLNPSPNSTCMHPSMWCVQYEEPQSSICQLVSARINLYITLQWHGSLSAKDKKKAAILGYSHDPTRHKLASTSRHYSQLTATWHDSTLLNSSTFFKSI